MTADFRVYSFPKQVSAVDSFEILPSNKNYHTIYNLEIYNY